MADIFSCRAYQLPDVAEPLVRALLFVCQDHFLRPNDMERIPRMLWNRSWLLAGHPCLERWPPRGSRNVLEVLGRVLLIGWTQHRTPRMGILQPNMPNLKGGHSLPFKNVRLLFPNGGHSPV